MDFILLRWVKKLKNSRTFIIAEAGINHNGKVYLAKKLIDGAKKAGADAVKFQTFKSENVISKFANKLKYQKNNSSDKESQLNMLKKFELSFSDFKILKKYCKKKNILFMSTPKDVTSAIYLNKLKMKIFKIGSGEAINYPLIRKIQSFKKKTIISTGMCTLEEVKKIVNIFSKNPKNLTLLHCTSLYPCPDNEANLLSIVKLKKTFSNLEIGFSDHTIGIDAAAAAVSLGSLVIEKHITINKSMYGPDHKASLNFMEFSKMVKKIRRVEDLLGHEKKEPIKNEKKQVNNIRRGLVYKKNLKKNYKIKKIDLTIKRPLIGLEPDYEKYIIGKMLSKDVIEDQPVRLKDFN